MVRPGNALLAAVGVAIGALAGAGASALLQDPGRLALAAAVGFAGTAYGNVLNDLHDQAIDRHAHPHRPLPSGRVTRVGAWNLALTLWFGSIAIGAFVGETFLLLTVVLLAALFLYERVFKRRGLAGNLLVAGAAGALFPLGTLAYPGAPMQPALLLGLIAAFAHLGRELLKDAEDEAADRSVRRTFAVRHGPPAATRLGGLFLVTAVAIAPLPHFVTGWGDLFLLSLLPAGLLFVGAAGRGLADPGAGRALAKLAMVAALVAFCVGALA